ncbi:MAG: hypothetical protein JST22_16095 [Bacteroidetes bacterium]|nr:hypothetical protein [Bacteroidota bacterium]
MSELTFTQEGSTHLYVPSDNARTGFLAFYLVSGTPQSLPIPIRDTWENLVGYYIFLRETPSDVAQFVTSLEDYFTGLADTQAPLSITHTGFLWLNYSPDESQPISQAARIVTMEQTDPYTQATEVLVQEQALIDFGGYDIPVDESARVVYTTVSEVVGEELTDVFTGFAFEYPANPTPRCPIDSIVPAPDPNHSLTVPFSGAQSGCFCCPAIVDDYFSDASTSWDVALRYTVDVGYIVEQFYPVFDLCDGRRPLLDMCWDPTDHLNPARTYLQFVGISLKWVDNGYGDCDYSLIIPHDADLMPTYFRTVTGERIAFAVPAAPARQPRLVFEQRIWPPAPAVPDSCCYYLVPSGDFELVIIDEYIRPIFKNDHRAQFPAQLMCGMSGVESVGFEPRDVSRRGDSMTFFAHHPAHVPKYPVTGPMAVPAPTGGSITLINDASLTAWATLCGINGANQGQIYYALPEDAPLYSQEGGDPDDEVLDLFEPVAAELPAPTSATCFPAVPIAGATPTTQLDPLDGGFLKGLETQILNPWRRETIRRFVLDPQGAEVIPVTGVSGEATTPQGLIADVCGTDWTDLVMAVSAITGTTIALHNLNPTIRAAFQSNQLFMVATSGFHFHEGGTTFDSVVKMGDWRFNIDPEGNNFANWCDRPEHLFPDLNNTMIVKFSPGKISERICDPRAWTNAPEFNSAPWLDDIAARLRAFMVEARLRALTDARYARFVKVIDDPEWTGVLGLNVLIDPDSMPAQLRVLCAGVERDYFVAHNIMVETGYPHLDEQTHAIVPAECSLFGLIDYTQPAPPPPDPNAPPPPPYDFVVKSFQALFENGLVAEMACVAELRMNEFFGESISGVTGSTGTGGNSVRLVGSYDAKLDKPGYVFTLSTPGNFELSSATIQHVAFRKAEFGVFDNTNQNRWECVFTFSGTITFKTLALDILSYDSLAYAGIVLRMNVPKQNPAGKTFAFEPGGISFDDTPGATTPRDNGLVRKFPMALQSLLYAVQGKLPADLGYVAVSVPQITGAQIAQQWYGIEYTLNLGTLGEFAANAGITIKVLVTWSPNAQTPSAHVWLKFPGSGGASVDLFSLQGVVKLGASSYELRGFTQEGRTGYLLKLNNFGVKILGLGLPLGGGPSMYVFGPPPCAASVPVVPSDDALGWLAVYKKP